MRYPVGWKNKIRGKFETLNGGSSHVLRRPPEEVVNRPKYSGLRWSGEVLGRWRHEVHTKLLEGYFNFAS